MEQRAEVFEKHYQDYCERIAGVDLAGAADVLGASMDAGRLRIPFFGREYFVSKDGIFDEAGDRPGYTACVILAKYVLLCPDRVVDDPQWVSFKDFKKDSHFTNVNFFNSDTLRAVSSHFAGRGDLLKSACKKAGGFSPETGLSYDLIFQFEALPRVALLLLFNDGDEDFPAECNVLFPAHAQEYLDPESLAMTGALLAGRVKNAG